MQAKLTAIPGLQIFAARPPALPGGGNFPVEFIITSTDEPERMLEMAQKLQTKAMESGVFWFPPEIDLKYDQPQSEIVDRLPEGRDARAEQRPGRRGSWRRRSAAIT